MKLYAYAKLNLALKIIGQRPDGYHELDMLMQLISLCDEVIIEKSDYITVRCDTWLPPDNTLSKAASAFFETTGITGGADIYVKKNIPEQAGLGGGSSDGATVLMALNEMYGAGLAKAALIDLGKKIGADVPFFIEGGCARAQGTGEILTPLRNNLDCTYLLAKPAGGVGT
ncbi:MAG: 4-(cytidine 5'-diphospho)-2-C-methyl-D-erythritol kinase, partial [Eubacteriales bacterium]